MTRIAVGLLVCTLLSACGQGDQQKKDRPLPAAFQKKLSPLPDNPEKAAGELEARFDSSVTIRSGFLIVRDPMLGDIDASILPANTSWVMKCGIGLTITFGSAVSGGDGDVQNDAELQLVLGMVPKKTCDVAGPMLGKHIQAILAAAAHQ